MRHRISRVFSSIQNGLVKNDIGAIDDFETFKQEHERLDAIIGDSENMWEDRTFQIAAGGLTLSFTVFSFLRANGISFDWQMIIIWGVFALCLILNYVSHRLSVFNARRMQRRLANMRENNMPYNEKMIGSLYQKQDRLMNWINFIVMIFLIADIVYTLVYTCIHLI